MFHRLQQYPVMSAQGRKYRPRAYGDRRADETWDGWLVFFPLDGGPAIASDLETTEPSFHAVTGWAANVSPTYLAEALDRALRIAERPLVLADLARAEYEALVEAEQLETRAALERHAAEADEAAALAARDDAQQLHRERLAAEEALAATEELSADLESVPDPDAAKNARAAGAHAGRQRTNRD
jgi:hypothetical protein